MISEPRPEFWESYRRLGPEAREQARKAYTLFRQNPWHPSLRFKALAGYYGVWSVRISRQYRAVGVRYGDVIQWFWTGTHNEFDKTF